MLIKTNEVYDLILKSLKTSYGYDEGFDTNLLSKMKVNVELGYLSKVINDCEELLANHCSDIRIISLYIYASSVWLTKTGLLGLCPLLKGLCQDHIQQILPDYLSSQAELEAIDASLAQLFRKIHRKLNFMEKNKQPELMDLLRNFDRNALADIQVNAQDLAHFLLKKLAKTQIESVNSISLFYASLDNIVRDKIH